MRATAVSSRSIPPLCGCPARRLSASSCACLMACACLTGDRRGFNTLRALAQNRGETGSLETAPSATPSRGCSHSGIAPGLTAVFSLYVGRFLRPREETRRDERRAGRGSALGRRDRLASRVRWSGFERRSSRSPGSAPPWRMSGGGCPRRMTFWHGRLDGRGPGTGARRCRLSVGTTGVGDNRKFPICGNPKPHTFVVGGVCPVFHDVGETNSEEAGRRCTDGRQGCC